MPTRSGRPRCGGLRVFRRKFRDLYYFDEGGECDFVAVRRHAPVLAVQACAELTTGDLDRELGGVRAAMARFGLKEGWTVTLDQTDTYTVPEGTVRVVPFHGFQP